MRYPGMTATVAEAYEAVHTRDIIGNSNVHGSAFANCALIGYPPGMQSVVPCLTKLCLTGQRKCL